ncbi:hypothetical protein NG754_04700 [Aliarcobacter cryaerophilus]|uniref:hypothetical protein n=1 Tax=Aliarcobacter cryaerophilus TaxID=28198 RepID=UPI003DA41CC5
MKYFKDKYLKEAVLTILISILGGAAFKIFTANGISCFELTLVCFMAVFIWYIILEKSKAEEDIKIKEKNEEYKKIQAIIYESLNRQKQRQKQAKNKGRNNK